MYARTNLQNLHHRPVYFLTKALPAERISLGRLHLIYMNYKIIHNDSKLQWFNINVVFIPLAFLHAFQHDSSQWELIISLQESVCLLQAYLSIPPPTPYILSSLNYHCYDTRAEIASERMEFHRIDS